MSRHTVVITAVSILTIMIHKAGGAVVEHMFDAQPDVSLAEG